MAAAAFANGAFSQALEFDDTHNESIVHMSSPAVTAALALAAGIALTQVIRSWRSFEDPPRSKSRKSSRQEQRANGKRMH